MLLCEVCSDCELDGVADHRQIAPGLAADNDGDGLPDACAGATSADDASVPERRSSLLVSYPNPFNPRTTLRLHLTEAAEVSLIIYNAKGQVVRRLVERHLPAGDHRFEWSARDDDGRVVSGGVYIAQVVAGSFRAQQKLVLLK